MDEAAESAEPRNWRASLSDSRLLLSDEDDESLTDFSPGYSRLPACSR